MALEIRMGCMAPYGQGGLGYHLSFISEAAQERTGEYPYVYSLGSMDGERSYSVREEPPWMFMYHYSPLRWSPAIKGRVHAQDFDRIVRNHLPRRAVVYHSFPGFAEQSFRKVRKYGGTAVLEAATTHADAVYQEVKYEHSLHKMGGSPFSAAWRQRVLREYELADYIVVSSEFQKESFTERGYPASKILRAPLGINTTHFSPAGGQHITSAHKFRIIQVGQVSLLKGFQYVLEALRRLRDPEIELVLLGGIGWRGIRRMVDRYRRDGVHVLHSSGDPVPWLRSAHLCVHASIQDGFGLAPLEAMSCGVPLIVTSTTGIQEALEDGVNGYVISSRNVDEIAERVEFLKHNENVRVEMARRARETALRYDAAAAKKNYSQALEHVWSPGVQNSWTGGDKACHD